jgi:hypothetical protein
MRTPAGIRELVIGAGVVVAIARFVEGPAAWIVAAILTAGVVLGALQVFGEADATTRARGVPIESLIEPGIVAFAGVGALRMVPLGLLLVPAIAVFLWLLQRCLVLEGRLAQATTPPSAADRTAVLAVTIVAGLAAFAGIAALVPGGLPGPGAGGTDAAPPSPSLVLGLAAADGLAGFLLAYRVAALRSSNIRDVGWAASTAAAVVAIAAAALRALDIPWLLGPSLLVLVFFLWEAMHGGAPARRREPRQIWEAALLLLVGLVVVAWSLGFRGV